MIVALNEWEIVQLAEAASRADAQGRMFRVSFDAYGVKWKVGEGMWTPSMGQLDDRESILAREQALDAALAASFDDEPIVLEPCDHVGAGTWITPGGAILCRGCGADADE